MFGPSGTYKARPDIAAERTSASPRNYGSSTYEIEAWRERLRKEAGVWQPSMTGTRATRTGRVYEPQNKLAPASRAMQEALSGQEGNMTRTPSPNARRSYDHHNENQLRLEEAGDHTFVPASHDASGYGLGGVPLAELSAQYESGISDEHTIGASMMGGKFSRRPGEANFPASRPIGWGVASSDGIGRRKVHRLGEGAKSSGSRLEMEARREEKPSVRADLKQLRVQLQDFDASKNSLGVSGFNLYNATATSHQLSLSTGTFSEVLLEAEAEGDGVEGVNGRGRKKDQRYTHHLGKLQ